MLWPPSRRVGGNNTLNWMASTDFHQSIELGVGKVRIHFDPNGACRKGRVGCSASGHLLVDGKQNMVDGLRALQFPQFRGVWRTDVDNEEISPSPEAVD